MIAVLRDVGLVVGILVLIGALCGLLGYLEPPPSRGMVATGPVAAFVPVDEPATDAPQAGAWGPPLRCATPWTCGPTFCAGSCAGDM